VSLGLKLTGTIAVLVMAERQGIIPALKPVIEAFQQR
jgi:predicted nucleic acid-binding protein